MQSNYFRFQIPYGTIHEYLNHGFKNIIFYVDLPSIARGFYNTKVIQLEITNYITYKKEPYIFFQEAEQFYSKLYDSFRQYSPKFITFYDNGECKQNRTLFAGYKNRVSGSEKMMLDDNERELFRLIKRYYYDEFVNRFNIPKVSKVIHLKEYEADFIPWVIISKNLLNSQDKKTLNVILSTDKDLLQCCQFKNTIQVLTTYCKKTSTINFNVYDDETAIKQIYKSFKRGILTSKYIPLMLALGKDDADSISGIEGIGPANAYKLIVQNQLPSEINESTKLPDILEPHRKLIMRNYKLTSFSEQIRRIPLSHMTDLIKNINSF